MLSPTMLKLLLVVMIKRVQRRRKVICLVLAHLILNSTNKRARRHGDACPYDMISRLPVQLNRRNRLYSINDAACVANLRMDRNSFGRLCILLTEVGGLQDGRHVGVEEQVSLFLSVLSHHKKQHVVGFDFLRSGQTVSHYVNLVLKSVLKLHSLLLVKPTPIPQDSVNPRWKWFKGCLGALDGTHIDVHVGPNDKGRFRTRKGRISTNVLGVCSTEMEFVYFLPGWEGSAADARVLRDAITRDYGLKVPRGNYYLCDNGYANSEGFLAPYRGCRYHLSEWGPNTDRPTNHQEHFNMRHTRARNVIERAFGVLKKWFSILRSPAFYPLKTQIRIIMACFLLHNFIRRQMPNDPVEEELDQAPDAAAAATEDEDDNVEFIDAVDSSPQFNQWRDQLSMAMYQMWRYPA